MSRNFRRLYSGFAILIFCISAPIVIVWTSGWRWTGWQSGFSTTGAVYITSTPRATVLINGQPQGQTPQHVTHLLPGNYTFELQRSGYSVWHHDIRVTGGEAQVIGPVQLFPTSFTVNTVDAGTAQNIIGTADHRLVFQLQPQTHGWQAVETWPNPDSAILLHDLPTDVSASVNQQAFAFWQSGQAAIITKQQTEPWEISVEEPPVWDTSSDSIFYDRSDDQLSRFDALQRTSTKLSPAQSFALDGDILWATTSTATTTTITRQQTFGQETPTPALQLDGVWTLQRLPGGITLKNNADHTLTILQYDALTHRTTPTSLGAADDAWWPDATQPPLWLNGADVLTTDKKNQPQLLDRLSETLTFAQWIDPRNILLTADRHTIRIQSVSSQQGRGTLLERSFDEQIRVIGVDLNQQTLYVELLSQSNRFVSVSWRL